MQLLSFYYYCGLLILFVMGLVLIFTLRKSKGKAYVKFRRRVIKDTRKKMGKELESPEASKLMFEAGLKVDSRHYNGLRYILVISVLSSQIGIQLRGGDFKPQFLLASAGIFLLSMPVEKVFGRPTPFGYAIGLLKSNRKDHIDKEIFEAMTQLKNLCVAQMDKSLSGDYLIEQIVKFSDVTKPAYSRMLTLWRLGYIEQGCQAYGDMLDTKMSREFSGILMKLESMPPSELADHLELYQSHIREERMTKHLRNQEFISYVLFAPVIGSAFLIMLNFMVIVIWLDTMELMMKI